MKEQGSDTRHWFEGDSFVVHCQAERAHAPPSCPHMERSLSAADVSRQLEAHFDQKTCILHNPPIPVPWLHGPARLYQTSPHGCMWLANPAHAQLRLECIGYERESAVSDGAIV